MPGVCVIQLTCKGVRLRILATGIQIRDLGCHVWGEEDIVGREISVNDGRSLAVEVAQAQSHVMKDGLE